MFSWLTDKRIISLWTHSKKTEFSNAGVTLCDVYLTDVSQTTTVLNGIV